MLRRPIFAAADSENRAQAEPTNRAPRPDRPLWPDLRRMALQRVDRHALGMASRKASFDERTCRGARDSRCRGNHQLSAPVRRLDGQWRQRGPFAPGRQSPGRLEHAGDLGLRPRGALAVQVRDPDPAYRRAGSRMRSAQERHRGAPGNRLFAVGRTRYARGERCRRGRRSSPCCARL